MSQAIHLFSKSVAGFGLSDSRCLPCSGISGRAVTISSCPYNVYRTSSQAKAVSLKCAIVGASFVCKVGGSSGQRRNPDFSRSSRHGYSRSKNRQSGGREGPEVFEESELLSSKNGPLLSISSSPKFQATATPGPREKEIVELFRKVQVQLRERAAIKEEKKIEALQGQSKESETVDSLLKILRKHSVEHGKGSSSSHGRGRGSSRDFILEQPKQNGLFREEKSTTFFESNDISNDDAQEPNASFTRPVSKFQRKSPIPRAKDVADVAMYSNKDAVNSFANLNSGENKRTSLVDTSLKHEPEYQPEPEPEPEPEAISDPEAEPDAEAAFSDEDITLFDPDQAYNNEDREEWEPSESRDLTALKLSELRSLAKSYGVKRYSKMKKSELVELLSSAEFDT